MTFVNGAATEAGAGATGGASPPGSPRPKVAAGVHRTDPTSTTWQTSGRVNVARAPSCPKYEGN